MRRSSQRWRTRKSENCDESMRDQLIVAIYVRLNPRTGVKPWYGAVGIVEVVF